MVSILSSAVLAYVVSFAATPMMIRLGAYLRVIDDPQQRPHPARLHDRPVPRGGGVPLFLGIAAGALVLVPLDSRVIGILAGGAVVVTVGFLDDRKWTIHPYWRLAAQFLAAGLVVASGIGIAFVSNPFGGVIDISYPRVTVEVFGITKTLWIFSSLLAFIWIVGLMNAVSWSSGVDGQLSGFTVVAASVVAIHLLRSDDAGCLSACALAVATAGAYLGFLPWHAYPQKIMPGFGGATLAGFMLAVLSMLASAKVSMMLVVLAIPIADAGFAILRRVLKGANPIWGDNLHLHHRLLRAGWTKRGIAHLYWVTAAAMGMIVLNVDTRGSLIAGTCAAMVVGVVLSKLREAARRPQRPATEPRAHAPAADLPALGVQYESSSPMRPWGERESSATQ